MKIWCHGNQQKKVIQRLLNNLSNADEMSGNNRSLIFRFTKMEIIGDFGDESGFSGVEGKKHLIEMALRKE